MSRIVRVRRLAHALHLILKPTAGLLPVIPEAARRKVEYIAFGLDETLNRQARGALEAFGVIQPIEETRQDGAAMTRAWVLQPNVPTELDAISSAPGSDESAAAEEVSE